jgi:hypothetical protein
VCCESIAVSPRSAAQQTQLINDLVLTAHSEGVGRGALHTVARLIEAE